MLLPLYQELMKMSCLSFKAAFIYLILVCGEQGPCFARARKWFLHHHNNDLWYFVEEKDLTDKPPTQKLDVELALHFFLTLSWRLWARLREGPKRRHYHAIFTMLVCLFFGAESATLVFSRALECNKPSHIDLGSRHWSKEHSSMWNKSWYLLWYQYQESPETFCNNDSYPWMPMQLQQRILLHQQWIVNILLFSETNQHDWDCYLKLKCHNCCQSPSIVCEHHSPSSWALQWALCHCLP